MKEITLHNKTFEIFISNKEIEKAVKDISETINASGIEKPLFIAVMNGAFLFAADLMRKISIPNAEISFVKLSSYEGTESRGNVEELIGINYDIEGRNIIILEDIIDTGNTLEKLVALFENKEKINK